MTYDPTWIRKSPILIPQAIQNDSLTAQKGSVRLDALDWGQKIGSTTLDSASSGSKSVSLQQLNNGKMFVAWAAGTDGRYSIVDSDGTMDSTSYNTFESGNLVDSTSNYGIATALLPDGNVVVAYAQNQSGDNALVFKIYSEGGTVVRDTVTVKVAATESDWRVGLAALPDGRFVIVWNESVVGAMSYFAIYDNDGDVVKGFTSLGGNYANPQVAPLSDGNWVVTYENSGIRYRTYDRQGIQILGETLFKTGVTQAPGIRTMGNGQILVPFTRGFGILDREGNVVVAPTVGQEAAGTYAVTVLPHDNIVAQNNNGTSAYYKIYDSKGTLLNSQVTYATDANAILSGNVATFKNGNFMLVYVAGTSNSVKMFIHQGTKAGFGGDLNISGALSLATGTSVNEISTDDTLADDSDDVLSTQKAVKGYIDGQIGSTSYRIFQGDSSVEVADSTDSSSISIKIDNTLIATFDDEGLLLSPSLGGDNVAVKSFSNDTSLGGYNKTSTTGNGDEDVVPTERAVRAYIDGLTSSQNEPTGFPLGNSNSVTVIGIDGSNSVYIEPVGASYDLFINGQRWVKTTKESVAITDVEGDHFVYFDTDGVLKQTTTFDISLLYTKGYVAVVYWDAVSKEIIYLGDERHGCTMDGKTHANIHLSRGTLYNSGLALADITADGIGTSDTEAQFSYSNGLITDEDITHTIPAQSLPAEVPVFYLSGSANWRKQDATTFPIVNTGSGRVGWNKDTSGTWSVEEAQSGYFVLMHIYATNDINGAEMIAIMGQAEYSTITAARAGAADEINSITKSDMPFAEFHPVATLIFETSNTFTNAPKAIIRTNADGNDWTDWRTSGLTPGAGSITDHGSLSGLANDDHLQYFLVNGTRNVTGNLTVEGTSTFEDSVEISGGTFILDNGVAVNEFSIDGTLGGDSTSAVPTEQAVKTYVDTAISNLNPDKIWEGDSSVEVIDDGTSTPRVDLTVDATIVGSLNATTQTIGKDAESKVVVADNDVKVYGGAAAALQATVNADGVTLASGASVNEFSIDGTLAGDSDDAVPTEQAVKTYVDTSIANLNPDKIWEGTSKVEVIDDGTATSFVEVVVDGVQVGYFDAESSSQRLGKAPGAGYSVVTADASAFIQDNSANNLLNLTTDVQRVGLAADTYVSLTQSTNTIEGIAGTTNVLSLTDTAQRFGVAGDTALSLNQTTNTITGLANNVTIFSGTDNAITLGVAADTFLSLTQDTGAVDLRADNVSVFNATSTTQRFGASGDTNLTLNTTADTFTLSAGAVTQISGGLATLSLGVAGDTTVVLDKDTDSVTITAGGQSQIMVETSGTTVYDDLTVTGDLFVDGTTFVVNQTEVRTADNTIVVNYGEPGAGVTAGTAGMQVDRGTLPDYFFIFAENTDTFRIGEEGDTQAVATREDDPESNVVPWWNDTMKRFDTAGDTYIMVDQTSGSVVISENSVNAFTVEENGITLETGATINEFSTDETLAGDSDTAVPTEKAVKAYVDAQIGGSANMIFEDDSYVKVIDDGTNTGIVEVAVDGNLVTSFTAAWAKLGNETTQIRADMSDSQLWFEVGDNNVALISISSFRIGRSDGSRIVGSHASTLDLYAGNTQIFDGNLTSQVFGVSGDSRIALDQTADTVDIYAGATLVVDLGTTSQVFGVDGDSRLELNQTADTAKLYAGASVVVDANPDVQVFGIGTDTYLTIDQTANTIVVTDNNTNVATFAEAGLTLQAGATIDEFSIDGTLAGDSDTAVPTEQAVKTYVDTAISNLNPDKIWEGNSYVEVIDDGTAAGYVSVVADGVEVAHFDAQSSTQRIGKAAESRILVADDDVKVYAGATVALQATFNANGFSLATGVTVNAISDSTALGSSASTLITQAAAKSYIDSGDSTALADATGYTNTEISTLTGIMNGEFADTTAYIILQDASTLNTATSYTDTEIDKLRNELDLVNVRVVTADTTAVSGDILLVDTTNGDVSIEMVEADDSRIIIKKKTTDGNKVNISTSPGTIDGQNLIIIDTPYQSFTFVSDGTNFYII